MSWQQQWIDGILAEVPVGSYRRRLEAELRDHLDSQYRALTEAGRTPDQAQAEALRAMGEPETLRKEFMAAWRRSWPARAEELRRWLKGWAGGFIVMGGVDFLIAYVLGTMWNMAISLPGDSQDKWVKLIRGTVGNLNNSYLRWWLPLVPALIAGRSTWAANFGRRLTPRRSSAWDCASTGPALPRSTGCGAVSLTTTGPSGRRWGAILIIWPGIIPGPLRCASCWEWCSGICP